MEQAAKACSGGGGEWTEGSEVSSCSKSPRPVGVEGAVQVWFCQGKLCKVRVANSQPDERAPSFHQRFLKIASALSNKYGSPAQSSVNVPGACENTLGKCLREKEANLLAHWNWPNQQSVSFSVSGKETGVVLSLEYLRETPTGPELEGL